MNRWDWADDHLPIRCHDEELRVPVHDDCRRFAVVIETSNGGRGLGAGYIYRGCLHPRLLRIQDLFGKLVVRAKGGVRIEKTAIFGAAEGIEP